MAPTPETNIEFSASKALETLKPSINIFGSNKLAERTYRRAEKISAGLILVTNIMSDSEPLKRRIRELAIDIIRHASVLKDELSLSESTSLNALKSAARELITHIRIAKIGGLVSEANGDLLASVIEDFGNFILSASRSEIADSINLTRESLTDIKDMSAVRSPKSESVIKDNRKIEQQVDDNTEIENTIINTAYDSEMPVAPKVQEPVKSAPPKIQVSPRTPKKSASSPAQSGGNGSRLDAIISVLAGGSKFGIRTINQHLPEFSAKMIQRALSELVDSGKVQKSGEKRWSEYELSR